MLFGDFNSRTANLPNFVDCDAFLFEINRNEDLQKEKQEILHFFETKNIPVNRLTADPSTNAYGCQLADFCKNNNMFILNGRLDTGQPKLTCKNSSTVDYILSTAHNFEIIESLYIHEFDSLFSDFHRPLSVELLPTHKTNTSTIPLQETKPQIRLWNAEKKDSYCENLNYGEILKILSTLETMSEGHNTSARNINDIINQIGKIFLTASKTTYSHTR